MSNNNEKKNKVEKKKNRALKIFLRIFLVFIILLVIFAGIAVGYISNKLGKINVEEIDETAVGINEETKEELSEYRNIALLGIDSRADDYGVGNRSDCIIIASINEDTNEIRLISVYRDTYLQIEEKGKSVLDKVTHAYAYGGAQNTLKALNTNLDLNITEYVTVNFDAVIAAVDAMGGIVIDVEEYELEELNGFVVSTRDSSGVYSKILSSAGKQTLNGVQAVAYSRIRHVAGGDYKRTERMRTVIEAMLTKAKSLSIGQLNNLIDTILPRISTNISGAEIISLVPSIASYKIVDSEGWPYKTEGVNVNKIYYGAPITLESNVLQLHQEVFNQTDYVADETVKEISQQIINKTGKK